MLRGVNLGGWLVLEKWLTPSLFKNAKATEEYWLCKELGAKARPLLDAHRSSFITENDFMWLKNKGVNAVRIPVGYWIFDDVDTYVGGIECLDWAMEMAEKHDLQVLIDLHAAAGSQNSWDHSGSSGILGWHTKPSNIEQAISVLSRLAGRYKSSGALWGIELLNEPHPDVPLPVLMDYYRRGYAAVRQAAGQGIKVVLSDAFRLSELILALKKDTFTNYVIDTHLYQLFTDRYKAMTYAEHIDVALSEWSSDLAEAQYTAPIIVGEWSAVLPMAATNGLTAPQKDRARQAYGAAQQLVFETTAGGFYWTYKTESDDTWDFRSMVDRGLLRP